MDKLFQWPINSVHILFLRFERYTHSKSWGSISENAIPSTCN